MASRNIIEQLLEDNNILKTALQELIDIYVTNIGTEHEFILRVLHCINYMDMEPAFREELFKKIISMFNNI